MAHNRIHLAQSFKKHTNVEKLEKPASSGLLMYGSAEDEPH
jgi:hypothetical protein